jgi:hypothetical protein
VVHLVSMGDPATKACFDMGDNYDSRVKELGKGHGLGAPHCRVLAAFVGSLQEQLQQQTELHSHKNYQILTKHTEFVAQARHPDQVGELVGYFRAKEIKTKREDGGNQAKITLWMNVMNKYEDDHPELDPKAMYRALGWAMEKSTAQLKTEASTTRRTRTSGRTLRPADQQEVQEVSGRGEREDTSEPAPLSPFSQILEVVDCSEAFELAPVSPFSQILEVFDDCSEESAASSAAAAPARLQQTCPTDPTTAPVASCSPSG